MTTTTTTTTTTAYSEILGRMAPLVTVYDGIAPVCAVYQRGNDLFADYGDGLTGPVEADFFADARLAGAPAINVDTLEII